MAGTPLSNAIAPTQISLTYPDLSPMEMARVAYVWKFLDEHPLKPKGITLTTGRITSNEVIHVHYGIPIPSNKNAALFIPRQELFFSANQAIQGVSLKTYFFRTNKYYSVQTNRQSTDLAIIKADLQFDLLESIFFHISRFEEHFPVNPHYDRWDMLSADHQLLVKHDLNRTPVVDALVTLFFNILGFVPDTQQRKLILTHDVDAILMFPSWQKVLRAIFRRIAKLELKGVFRILTRGTDPASSDPYDTFHFLLDASFQCPKVIFIMAGGQLPLEGYYSIQSEPLIDILDLALKRGYEIGLHPSYLTWKDADMMNNEKNQLSALLHDPVVSSRQHYLHFSFPETIQNLEKCCIPNDYSLGYQDRIGFRCGTGYSYHLYSFAQECGSSIKETPLIIMDTALREEAIRTGNPMSLIVRNFLSQLPEGQICVNVHNSSFDNIDWDKQEMMGILEMINTWSNMCLTPGLINKDVQASAIG